MEIQDPSGDDECYANIEGSTGKFNEVYISKSENIDQLVIFFPGDVQVSLKFKFLIMPGFVLLIDGLYFGQSLGPKYYRVRCLNVCIIIKKLKSI